MISNIGLLVNVASQTEQDSAASQIYLWCISRINMNKVVHRSIIARRTPMEVKTVIAEFTRNDRIPCGMTVRGAIDQFSVCQMLTRMFEGTFVYLRRKPTSQGLSKHVYQLVMSWNSNCSYATMCEPAFECRMRAAYMTEQNTRLMRNPYFVAELQEEQIEREADRRQMERIVQREFSYGSGLISPVSFD